MHLNILLLSLLNLRKGSYSIISGNNSQGVLIARCKMNPTHSWGSYSMLYRNDSGNINLSLKNYSYTPCFAAWSKRNVCKSRIGSSSLIFRKDFGVSIWLQHNTLYGLIDSENMHIPCHFMDKTVNPMIMKCEISSSVNHMGKISLFELKRGIYIIILWNFSKSTHLTLHNDSHTLIYCWLHHL